MQPAPTFTNEIHTLAWIAERACANHHALEIRAAKQNKPVPATYLRVALQATRQLISLKMKTTAKPATAAAPLEPPAAETVTPEVPLKPTTETPTEVATANQSHLREEAFEKQPVATEIQTETKFTDGVHLIPKAPDAHLPEPETRAQNLWRERQRTHVRE